MIGDRRFDMEAAFPNQIQYWCCMEKPPISGNVMPGAVVNAVDAHVLLA